MMRVAFILSFNDASWTGAINYYKNLLTAIDRYPQRTIEPVIFAPPGSSKAALAGFPAFETVFTDRVDAAGLKWKISKVRQRLLGRDGGIERFLKEHGVAVLSHSGHLGARAGLPTIGWIPDFQHLHMPDFFSPAERQERDQRFKRLLGWCSRTLVSSESALADLRKFAPEFASRARVLRFVGGLAVGVTPTAEAVLREKYALDGPYLHLPNQFWVHKNHRIVLQALAELKRQGRDVTVIATGNQNDVRQPAHFGKLMALAQELDIGDSFRSLGLVPFADLQGLMQHSAAVLNPSLFEGWSTTVEEAKSLGKSVILSDIPVHREQAPARSRYFDPNDAVALAQAIVDTLRDYTPETEQARRAAALEDLPQRVADFAKTYQDIVLEAAAA